MLGLAASLEIGLLASSLASAAILPLMIWAGREFWETRGRTVREGQVTVTSAVAWRGMIGMGLGVGQGERSQRAAYAWAGVMLLWLLELLVAEFRPGQWLDISQGKRKSEGDTAIKETKLPKCNNGISYSLFTVSEIWIMRNRLYLYSKQLKLLLQIILFFKLPCQVTQQRTKMQYMKEKKIIPYILSVTFSYGLTWVSLLFLFPQNYTLILYNII